MRHGGRSADLIAGAPGRAFALELDVTDRAQTLAVADEAVQLLGRLDVVVNCAGYGLHAPVEETTEQEARAQMETNFFGALWVAQAVMPHLPWAGNGPPDPGLVGGRRCRLPARRPLLRQQVRAEGLTESLALEAAPFGVRVTIVQPADFRTSFREACHRSIDPAHPTRRRFPDTVAVLAVTHLGERSRRSAARRKRCWNSAAMREPPLRFLLGNRAFDVFTAAHRRQLDEWER